MKKYIYPRITFRLPEFLRTEVTTAAIQHHSSEGQIVRNALINYLRGSDVTNAETFNDSKKSIIEEI